MYFANPAGIYAFIGVLILIVIYLIRPRAKDIVVPSLMFIMKDKATAKKFTFLERLLSNLIFILQLIAIGLMAFSILQPSMKTSYDTTAENTIIIFDVSASMQADNNARFREALRIAKDSLKGDVSIILAEESPLLILEKGSPVKAASVLDSLVPKDVGTDLGDAILLSKDLLKGEEGRVLVLSDFITTAGPDPEVVKKILEADKAVVDFVNVADKSSKGNVGFVDLALEKHSATAYLKNFNQKEKAVTVSIVNEDKEVKRVSKTVLANSVETVSFEVLPGLTQLKIEDKDSLDIDNNLYLSMPESAKIRVLVITNKVNTFLKYALESSKDIELTTAEPPVIPDVKKFDVVILSDFDKGKLLTGTIDDIKKSVADGKNLIIMPQDDLSSIDFLGMMPVTINGKVDKVTTSIEPSFETNSQKYASVDNDVIDYGNTVKYFTTVADNSSIVYALAAGNPIIASKKSGQGNVVFYGIFDKESSFKSSPSYPLFWNTMINSLMGTEDVYKFNYKTGKILSLPGGEPFSVKTPNGIIKTKSLIMDKAGFYEVEGRNIVANMLNEKESDIDKESAIKTATHTRYTAAKVMREKETNLENYALIAIVLVLLGELFYTKYRGDI